MTNSSRFESAARAKKVLAILRVVPTGKTTVENRLIAEFLEGLSVPERAVFAKAAHVNAPSDETWRALVDEVKARTPADEAIA